MHIPLTPLDRRLLLHRLEAGGAIAESLGEDFPPSQVEIAVAALIRWISTNDLDPENAVQRAILADCIEGSTYLASISERRDSEWTVAEAAMRRLAAKLSAVVGRELRAPIA